MLQKKTILALTLVLMAVLPLSASRTLVTARLDSAILMMGRMTHMRVSVDQNKDAKGVFPLFYQMKENGIVGVCGDSVELRAPVKSDTSEKGGMLHIEYTIPVQAFDSGYYQLPEIAFVVGRDTAFSNKLALKVVPVVVDANTPIDDYANVADPEDKSIFDAVPDWVLDYWWIILLVVVAVAAFLYAWMKYKKEGSILGKKPEPTPYEVAVSALRELKDKKLWEQGMEKEYFTELTDVLRVYLFGRFGINAMEMTSRQILGALKNNKETRDKRDYIRQILNMADFVKFAKVRPLPDDNIASFENALKFVEETKPLPPADDEQSPETNQNQNDNSKKKNKKITERKEVSRDV